MKTSDGVVATSFKKGDPVYISPDRLLPLDRFLPKAADAAGAPRTPGGSILFIFLKAEVVEVEVGAAEDPVEAAVALVGVALAVAEVSVVVVGEGVAAAVSEGVSVGGAHKDLFTNPLSYSLSGWLSG